MTKEEAIALVSKNVGNYGYENIVMDSKSFASDSPYLLLAGQGYLDIDLKARDRHYVRLTDKGLKYALPSQIPTNYKVRTATVQLNDHIEIKDTLIDGRVCTKVVYQYLLSDFTPFNSLNGDTDRVLYGERTYERDGLKWKLLFASL
ncbi:hypothetical protein GCM10022209_23630 [Chitinophaga oryziterrae]